MLLEANNMIIDFTFKNFKSFADECNFTMKAETDKNHESNLIAEPQRLSKTRVIYGANAAGKTSFVEAINFVKMFLVNSNNMMTNQKIQVNPYKFRDNFIQEPSFFSLTFIKEGMKFNYEFSCTRDKVLSERLNVYYSAKATNIFTRINTNEYKFLAEDAKLLEELKIKNAENKLFLATADAWNYTKVKPIVDYILNDIVVSFNLETMWKLYFDEITESGEMEEYRKFCLEFLNNADLSIDDFDVQSQKIKDAKLDPLTETLLSFMEKDNPNASEHLRNTNVYNFTVSHRIANGDDSKIFKLSLQEESLGTVNMFQFAPILYYVFKKNRVLVVDEIDKSLHPLLVKYLYSLFLNSDINKCNSQLIANTHDTNLLDLDFFRRDEIWFTERNFDTGTTTMFPLSDFSPRTNENIERSYLLGRFGAIPFIKEV